MTSHNFFPVGADAPVDEEVAYPQPFGPYALLCALGRGGMGAVHLAKHGSVAGIEKYCVVKTLRQKHADNGEYIARFMDEARLVVHLAHRNICPIFDVGKVGSRYYLAMELIEGRDLNTLLERCWAAGRPLPVALALHIACELLEALDYAHRRAHPVSGQALHIVHRDVSPHNVMVNFEGEVKLIDFGLAASSLKVERTDPKVVLGKLSYMSREHLRAQPVDGRHDLFGVAVMLYEMLASERYYAGVPPEQLLPLLADGEHVPRRLGAFDDELRGILSRALAREARARTPTCGQLRDQLQQYMLRRQLSASTRDLRALLDELFPGEQGSVRALLQRFQDVRPPARPDEQSRVIARAGANAPAAPAPVDIGPLPGGTASRATTSSVGFSPDVPNPITEPTGRVEVPASSTPAAYVASDVTQLLPRVVEAHETARRASHTALYAASAALLVLVAAGAAAWFFLLAPALDEGASAASLPRAPLTSTPAPPPEAPAQALDPPPAEPLDDDVRASEDGPVAEHERALDEAPAATAPVVEEEPASAPLEASKRTAAVRRAATGRARRAPPPIPADATPEEKVRYLDDHCRAHACGRSLVERFENVGLAGMSTDEVRRFWPRVNRCLEVCSAP